jgi:hypothetical protein
MPEGFASSGRRTYYYLFSLIFRQDGPMPDWQGSTLLPALIPTFSHEELLAECHQNPNQHLWIYSSLDWRMVIKQIDDSKG